MQRDLIDFDNHRIVYEAGDSEKLSKMQMISAKRPFSGDILDFLNDLSRCLMTDRDAKAFSDVMTFAFWIRKASTAHLKSHYLTENEGIYKTGCGTVFHIAPSNVAVNYAYSMVAGLLGGNANIVRISSKYFPQVEIINKAIRKTLTNHPQMEPYIVLLRYGHDEQINDWLSAIADVRIIWGGNHTIREFRKSPLKERAREITFADRYSVAVIDSQSYLSEADKDKVAQDFYNDTYLMDQNACTSPRLVAWVGNKKEEAKEVFWKKLHSLLLDRYEIQAVQAIHKLTSAYRCSALREGVRIIAAEDNLIVRVVVDYADNQMMDIEGNSGFFFEVDCGDILELHQVCNDVRCQTITYLGNKKMFYPLLESGVRGVDRIVPMGESMNFDIIWDGYHLIESLTKTIVVK